MKVLVCGGRNYNDEAYVFKYLDFVHENANGPISVIINGGAMGADELSSKWSVSRNKQLWVYKADWKKHGKAAGPIRNQQMIDDGKPDFVIAFPGGKGTADMVRRARAAGVPVIEVKG